MTLREIINKLFAKKKMPETDANIPACPKDNNTSKEGLKNEGKQSRDQNLERKKEIKLNRMRAEWREWEEKEAEAIEAIVERNNAANEGRFHTFEDYRSGRVIGETKEVPRRDSTNP